MNTKNVNVVELNAQELTTTEGGVAPLIIAGLVAAFFLLGTQKAY